MQTYQKKCVTLILYGFRDCPAEIVDPNQLQDFTLGRVSKKSAIIIFLQFTKALFPEIQVSGKDTAPFFMLVTLVDTY